MAKNMKELEIRKIVRIVILVASGFTCLLHPVVVRAESVIGAPLESQETTSVTQSLVEPAARTGAFSGKKAF